MSSSFGVRNYSDFYRVQFDMQPLLQGGLSAEVIQTPTHSRNAGRGSGFVRLSNGKYVSVRVLTQAGVPPPKFAHAYLKEKIIQGKRIVYYEYPSDHGHKCRLEIIAAPDEIGTHYFDTVKGKNSARARKTAENNLEGWVTDRIQELARTQSKDTHTDPFKETNRDDDTEISPNTGDGNTPESNDDFIKPANSHERKEEIRNDVKNGIKEGFKAYKEAGKAEDVEEYVPLSFPQNKSGSVVSRSLRKVLFNVDKSAQEVLKSAREEVFRGKKHFKQADKYGKLAEIIDDKLENGGGSVELPLQNGKNKVFTRTQAKRLQNAALIKSQTKTVSAVEHVFSGTAKASLAHGTHSAVKRLAKEVDGCKRTGLDSLGANLGSATVGFLADGDYSFDAAERTAVHVVGQTAKGVAVGVAKNVAYSTLKGVAKEVAPALAKKIPGISTVNAVYSVGKAVLSAETIEEAIGNGISASMDTVISLGCTAGAQALIPVPFVGAFVGSLVGSAIIYGKNQLLL